MRQPTDVELLGPVPALSHRGVGRRRGIDGVALLTVYLVLLLAIPSSVTITALGSLGRPSFLWGLVLALVWTLSRLQRTGIDVKPVFQPVTFLFAVLVVIALVSFAAAMLRGQPGDQVSPAMTSLLRLVSWAGVLMVAVDGIRTMNDLATLARRIVVGGGLLAILGILQFLTGQVLIDFFAEIPGLTGAGAGVSERGGVVRSAGTAIHPLEFATALNAILPIAVAAAISRGFRSRPGGGGVLWWIPVVLISITAVIGVSRSAIIGFALAAALMVPAFPRRYRVPVMAGGLALIVAVLLAVPGLLGTTMSLFLGASDDPSTASRVSGLDRAPEFISFSPLIGAGFGTFLPRYYIFDNQWAQTTIELGILGVAVFAGLVVAAIWSALAGRKASHEPDAQLLGHALAASMAVFALLFAFFDGLYFPISAGLLFLFAGLCGALRTVGAADQHLRSRQKLGPDQELSEERFVPGSVSSARPSANPGFDVDEAAAD